MDAVSLVKAVLFALDGVLIDSEPVLERVRRDFGERLGGLLSPDLSEKDLSADNA